MAQTWRNDLAQAQKALKQAQQSGASWVDLLFVEQHLKAAKEAISSAITRLNGIKKVREAKKHVTLRSISAPSHPAPQKEQDNG